MDQTNGRFGKDYGNNQVHVYLSIQTSLQLLSIYPSIYPFNHPSIHLSIHPSIHPSIHRFITPFRHTKDKEVNKLKDKIDKCNSQIHLMESERDSDKYVSIHPPISPSTMYLSIYLYLSTCIYLSICSLYHLFVQRSNRRIKF